MTKFKNLFSRTTGLTPTKLGEKRPWVKGVQVSTKNKETFNSLKVIMLFFNTVNQRYGMLIALQKCGN